MPSITSEKTRQMILGTGDPLLPGEHPEKLTLYKADGSPMDLTKDSTRMLWRGEWVDDETYYENDVVIDEGDLFILKEHTIGVGGVSPSDENAEGEEITVPFPGGGAVAHPLVDGERIQDPHISNYRIYFDLIVGGTFTIKDLDLPTEFIQVYASDGTALGTNYGAPDSPGSNFGGSYVKTDATPGRYFVQWQEAVYVTPGPMHLQVTLSEGAQFPLPIVHWEVLFRASSGPTGPTGPAGPTGPTGDDGPPGTSFLDAWKGDWAAGAYVEGDVVRHSAGLYVATDAAIAADEPGVSPDPNPWELLVQGA